MGEAFSLSAKRHFSMRNQVIIFTLAAFITLGKTEAAKDEACRDVGCSRLGRVCSPKKLNPGCIESPRLCQPVTSRNCYCCEIFTEEKKCEQTKACHMWGWMNMRTPGQCYPKGEKLPPWFKCSEDNLCNDKECKCCAPWIEKEPGLEPAY